MMTPENRLKKDFAKRLNSVPGIQGYESIENTEATGTPDFAYTIRGEHGWIEFKYIPEPKRETTLIRLPHWTKVQRDWMRKREESPMIFLVLRVGEWDYIFDSDDMFKVESMTLGELKKHRWRVKFSDAKLWGNSEYCLLSDRLNGYDYFKED